ncbi:helix-turn-helix domain-containing protein [Clostridium algidicarnis]|uniref:phage terminase small subunit n=1 Tax=Clostridium algidicarnis TaxID=37659 RepID=UPI001C0D3534|nr:phage terminase small subunit [Clostridium algidicarnis]MBU3195660.1 helix-turn-helix domain-containing protein [Clostridium algidicarnis]
MTGIRGPDIKDIAKQDYLKGMKYKELAEKYKVSINTVKSWVKRYNWSEDKKQRGAHKSKKGAPLNNKNAVGHGAPAKNKNAETHGFFSKYLPEETLGIIEEIKEKDSLDIIWENITIQYAAIIRSQRIMYVKDKDEMIKELKKEEHSSFEGGYTDKTEWEFQFAWDRQATFLNAQSRAMGELRSLIKQYDEMLNTNWDLATEEQKLRIQKLKADISKDDGKDKPIEILIKRKGED